MHRARLVGGLGVVGLAAVATAAVLVPDDLGTAGVTGQRAVSGLLADVPTPVLVGVALLGLVVLWFLAIRYVLVLCYRAWRRISARVYWALTLVLPESPLVKFAAGGMVLIGVVILVVGGLPALVGDLADSDEGAAGYADRLSSEAVDAEWGDVVNGDAVGGQPACDGSVAAVDGDSADRDQDGLPDAWERAGETPAGAPLPDADPGRKDLYVQVNYGSGVEPLTDAERDQLGSSWAEMPVANPDGSTGVALHVDDSSERAGDMGERARITATGDANTWYTDDHLGPRQCVYRQVVYGDVAIDGVGGVGATPGYSTVVHGAYREVRTGTVTTRVGITNHELLHTAAGNVDGKPHTSEGWLAGGSNDEFLAAATAADLNETGIYGPAS